jgi:hypothetical protein
MSSEASPPGNLCGRPGGTSYSNRASLEDRRDGMIARQHCHF